MDDKAMCHLTDYYTIFLLFRTPGDKWTYLTHLALKAIHTKSYSNKITGSSAVIGATNTI